jgi:hypothetical protein
MPETEPTLTEAEREALSTAGEHRPSNCDCDASGYEPGADVCTALEDTFAEVERIVAAREAAIWDEAKVVMARPVPHGWVSPEEAKAREAAARREGYQLAVSEERRMRVESAEFAAAEALAEPERDEEGR